MGRRSSTTQKLPAKARGLELGHFVFTAKGLRRSAAQGCSTKLPWGTVRRRPTPNGVYGSVPKYDAHPILRCACAAVPEAHLADGEGRNPFRVGTQFAVVPKVAEYSNLGL